jgi:small subunit ribosomal protein S24e
MEIEILEEKQNPLIDRTEVKFRLQHFGESTPNRLEVKKKIAAMQGSDEKLTIIRKIKSFFGSTESIGSAYVYGNAEDLQFYEPFHIQVRNLPSDKRKEVYSLKKKRQPYKQVFEY